MFYDEYCKLCNGIGKAPSACAEDMGFQRSVITRWKAGSVPRYATMLKIADYFGVEPDVLNGVKKEPVEDKLSDIQQMLIDSVRQMSDEDASMLLILSKQLTARGKSQDVQQSI